MGPRIVTVFGAAGFLGQRIVRHLHVQVASRHPEQGRPLFGTDDQRLQPIRADIRDGKRWLMRSRTRTPQ